MFLCGSMSHVCSYLRRPEEGVASRGAEATGHGESPDVGSGN